MQPSQSFSDRLSDSAYAEGVGSTEENMDGFDFQNTWRVVTGDYPALQWEE